MAVFWFFVYSCMKFQTRNHGSKGIHTQRKPSMSTPEITRKKIDNDDGTITLVFYTENEEVARTVVDKHYDVIKREGTIPDGMVRQYYDSGRLLAEAAYANNMRHGLTTLYHEDGSLWLEIQFHNDRAQGQTREYYPNGVLFKETAFHNGTLEGLSREYYENGQLKFEWEASGGKPEGMSREYYENGQLKSELENVSGKPEGIVREFYDTGQLKSRGNYINGKREGLLREYYPNGVMKGEWNYTNDMREGIAREYFENGEIKYLDTYKRDQRINRKAYLEREDSTAIQQEQDEIKQIKDLLVTQGDSYLHYQNQILERIRLVEKRLGSLEETMKTIADRLTSTT